MAKIEIPRALTETRCACGTTRRRDRLGRTYWHVGAGAFRPLIDARDTCPVCRTFASDHDYWEGGEGRCSECDGRWHSHRISNPDVPLLHELVKGDSGWYCVCEGWGWSGAENMLAVNGWWTHIETVRMVLIEKDVTDALKAREKYAAVTK